MLGLVAWFEKINNRLVGLIFGFKPNMTTIVNAGACEQVVVSR